MADDNDQADELRPEYRREEFPAGLERRKYTARMAEGSNIVRIDLDLVGAFPESIAVNEALLALLQIAALSTLKPNFISRVE